MKKFAVVLLMLMMCPSFAIDWLNLKSAKGTMFALDVDSIREEGNYYFYNLKVLSSTINHQSNKQLNPRYHLLFLFWIMVLHIPKTDRKIALLFRYVTAFLSEYVLKCL